MTRKILLFFLLVLSLCGCEKTGGYSGGGSGSGSSPYFDATLSAGTLSFEALPAATSEIQYIIPLGNLNPPAHTIPSNHIYFVRTSSTIEVHAPAGGKVESVNLQDANFKVYGIIIGVTSTDAYYMYHVVLNPVLKAGDTVTAGQVLGTPDPSAAAFDLGVVRSAVTNAYVNPGHFMDDSIHGDSPLKYFVEPYKTRLYSLVQRNGSDKDGKFCYDKSGKLVGGWYHESLPNDSTVQNVTYGSQEAAFVYDAAEPAQIKVSLGGSIGNTTYLVGHFFVQNGAIDPANVTASTGKITYKLYSDSAKSSQSGILVVQMTADDKIKVDATYGASLESMAFTSNAKNYVR